MKKLSIMAVMIMMLIMGIVSCSNENLLTAEQSILTEEESLDCETTIIVSVNNGRSWTPALYRLTATNKATDEVINVPDSNTDHITYNFSKGTYLFELKAFDENHNLIYRGKTELVLNAASVTCEIFALKNSGSAVIDLSQYAGSASGFNEIQVTAASEGFQTVNIKVSDFDEKAVFEGLPVGECLFSIYSVTGTKIDFLGSQKETVTADLLMNVTARYVTTTTSSTTTSSTTTTSTTTTTTLPFDGYRVHVYGNNWSTHSVYYYNSGTQTCGTWPGKTMTKGSNTYYYDMKESWVEPGKTMVIFYGGDNSNRYPFDGVDGVVFPTGVREAWFNITTKDWETSDPFSTDPVVAISPSGNASFSGATQSVSITSKYCKTAKYTTDGTDPSTSNTAVLFSGNTSFVVGSGLSVGQSVTVKVYGTDDSKTVTASATYTKIDRPATPTRLGAYYTSSATSFSIWSPDSSNVTVTVTPKNGSAQTYTCTKNFTVDGGYSDTSNIYGVTVPGDLHLAEYQFKIGGKAVRDPYGVMIKYENEDAKTNVIKADYTENNCTVTSYAGSSVNIVVDLDKTDPDGGWAERPALANRCDSIVYEVHIGDFTSSSTWGGTAAYAGKYPGMVEAGTKYGSTKTGLDHLKELGITHVQIMPMYDFATKYNKTVGDKYNWGYDPVNYNVPEDRYSTCPSDYVARIKEVKNMINEFHKAGIRVVMDVVYNHTFDKEMFKDISGKYYTTTDLSGCGNSVDTGNEMVSRFIRDSLEYWADEYNIDGFRFDLLGIYHTSAVKHWGEYINSTFSGRNILMYGEPWNGYATDNEAIKVRMSAVSGMSSGHIGVFNGKYRETIKGSSDSETKGFMFNADYDGDSTAWNVGVGLRGSGTSLGSDNGGYWTRYFTATPDQSINYITAHDNLCLYDKIVKSGVTSSNEAYQTAIVKFGHGMLLVSQGIPFIHAGDEFLRTKAKGPFASEAHNSYMFGQTLNEIDWSRKATYAAEFKFHKDLIAFRKANDGLRNRNGVGSASVSNRIVYYTVKNSSSSPENANKTLTIVVNPSNNIEISDKGTMAINKTGAVSSGTTCEGTGVTIFVK